MAAVKYNYNPSCTDENNDCYAPPVDFACVDMCSDVCSPCEDKCPPRVRAKDAICLPDDEWERCMSLYGTVGCEPTRLPAQMYCIELQVRRQGLCRVLTCECPIRVDNLGNACFQWSDDFRALPAGYYEADLLVNNKHCFTLLFRKKKCWTRLETVSVEVDELPCEPPEQCCTGCAPSPDFEQDIPLGDCNADRCE